MALPDSYTVKTGSIPAYFDAILGAEAPDRFSIRFLENLGYTSSNDRLIIGILKDLGFLNADGVPQQRYFEFLDRENAYMVLAEGIRDAYSELFAVNKEAYKLDADGAYNKLRTLYKGSKKDTVVKLIARTFTALCEISDFSRQRAPIATQSADKQESELVRPNVDGVSRIGSTSGDKTPHRIESLQYNINIILPETRDQAVFDAIFKSLREHLV